MVSSPFVEKIIFTPSYCLCFFVKGLYMWVYFWALYSVPLILKLGSVSSPADLNGAFFSSNVLVILGPLPLHINFTISLLIFTKQLAGVFDWHCVESTDQVASRLFFIRSYNSYPTIILSDFNVSFWFSLLAHIPPT